MPTAIVVLESLPLTVNGKLDRRSLPAPDFTVTGTTEATRAPATATEAVLADLFAEVLGRGSIGVDDSFFGLGGDSIMSIQLVSRAKSAGLVFTPRDVFEAKTVAGLHQSAPHRIIGNGTGSHGATRRGSRPATAHADHGVARRTQSR